MVGPISESLASKEAQKLPRTRYWQTQRGHRVLNINLSSHQLPSGFKAPCAMMWVPMRVVGDLAWQPVQLSLTLTSFSISYAAASLIVSVVANEYETFPVGSLLCQLLYPAADIITSKSKCPLGENTRILSVRTLTVRPSQPLTPASPTWTSCYKSRSPL